MPKRATLSLSLDEGINKQQASDLKSTSRESAGTSNPPNSANVSASPKTRPEENGSFPQQNRDWIRGRSIVKTVVVIAAAALSLYLLRRRLS